MVRGDFSALWKRFKSVTKKDPGTLFTTQFICFTSRKIQMLTPEPPAPPQFTCFPSAKVLALLVHKYKYWHLSVQECFCGPMSCVNLKWSQFTTNFTCFTGTKVQILTPERPGVLLWADELCEPKVNMAEAKYSFRHYGYLKTSVWGLKLLVYEALSY